MLRRELQIFNCLRSVVAATVMMSQVRVAVFEPRIKEHFDPAGGAFVQVLGR